jgi:hypothetical protein
MNDDDDMILLYALLNGAYSTVSSSVINPTQAKCGGKKNSTTLLNDMQTDNKEVLGTVFTQPSVYYCIP